MTTNIHPTQGFILAQFVSDSDAQILMPDGQRNPNGDIVVLEVGPDVPKIPLIEPGSKLLLRSDTKTFDVDEKEQTFMVDHRWVMAVVSDPVLTDEQIRDLEVAGAS